MERITLILISIALAFLSLPGAASAADTVPYPDVVGGPEIVCTPQKCRYELRCEPVDPFGCLYGDLTLGTRYQVFTKFNSEQLSSPYSGVIGSGRSVKLRTSPFGRKEIKRYLQRDKRKLSGGWDLSRLEAIFISEQDKETLLAREAGWYVRDETLCDFDDSPFTPDEPCYSMGQASYFFQKVVLRLKA
jgi:hypothetical protein